MVKYFFSAQSASASILETASKLGSLWGPRGAPSGSQSASAEGIFYV